MEYRHDIPFKFTGKIDKLTFRFEPEPSLALTPGSSAK